MQSIIHKLGFIAVLVTTVTAFELYANTEQQLDSEVSEPTKTMRSQQHSDGAAAITHLTPLDLPLDSQGLTDEDSQQINSLLNQLHESAMSADWDTYFDLYHPDAAFIGTDATERWNMVHFRRYASPTQGWRYDLQARHLLQIEDVVVFDEQLYSLEYGISRGTGALVNTTKGWKIAQYHLSFPIPNAKAKRITTLIKQ